MFGSLVRLTITFSAAGVSRSASFVICYLMKLNAWKYDEAFKHLKSVRSVVYPNMGFVKQLRKYEVTLGLITEEYYYKYYR